MRAHWYILVFLLSTVCANECSEGRMLAVPSFTSGSTGVEPLLLVQSSCTQEEEERGVWYRIQPPTNTIITVHTCGSCFDTNLFIYDSNCQSLSCIVYNDDSRTESCNSQNCPENNILSSRVSFCTTGGEYNILIQGFGGQGGNYELHIAAGDSCVVPSNNNCPNAERISNLGEEIPFSNLYATGGLSSCFGVEEEQHSIWYKVIGSGNSMAASTCYPQTDFQTSIAVFKGHCGALECVDANEENIVRCSQGLSFVSWCGEAGTEYFIFITGSDESSGSGVLTISDGNPNCNQIEGTCTSPIPIRFDQNGEFVQIGRMILNLEPITLPICDVSNVDPNTILWFSVRGNGNIYSFSTEGSSFDSVVSVYQNSCFNLECVIWNDASFCNAYADYLCPQAALSLCTEQDRQYFIALGSVSDEEGEDYSLYVADIGPCTQRDSCFSGSDYLDYPGITYGDLELLSELEFPFPSCGLFENSLVNAWFAIEGRNSRVIVSTVGSCFDTTLSIYESLDNCEFVRCIEANEDALYLFEEPLYGMCGYPEEWSATSFCAAVDHVYYIIVGGFGGEIGPFTLSIEEEGKCLSNDNCPLSELIAIDDRQFVDLSLPQLNQRLTCNSISCIGGAWYEVTGTGGLFLVEIPPPSSVLVFTSLQNDCVNNNPTICVEGGIFSADTSIEFCTVANQTYWILLCSSTTITDISFIVRETGGCFDVENDNCERRQHLDISTNSALLGSNTDYAGGDIIMFSCNGISFEAPGNAWYSVIGSGRIVSISLLSSDFSVILAVLESSCEYRTCVESNSLCNDCSLEFCGHVDIEYLILVDGSQNESGNFQLLIQETGRCANTDLCSNAVSLAIPSTVVASTARTPSSVDRIGYQIPTECVIGQGYINTHWYSFQSSESRMIDIHIRSQEFPVVSGIFTSYCVIHYTTCGSFVDRDSTNSLQKVCGAYPDIIYVMVGGENDRRGNYSISIAYSNIACTLAQQTSNCTNANEIAVLPHNVYGDSSSGIPFFEIICEDDSYAFGLDGSVIMSGLTWYHVFGGGFIIEVNGCSNAPKHVAFVVMRGSCNTNECLSFTPITECSLSWCGIPGEDYYVKLGSFGAPLGDYELIFREMLPCVGPPDAPSILLTTKKRDELSFYWFEPFSFGFPVLDYHVELFDENEVSLQMLVSQNNQITFRSLVSDSVYEIRVSARNEWGVGEYGELEVSTATGMCNSNPVSLVNATLVPLDDNIRGILFSPRSSGVIHSIEVPYDRPESNLAYIAYWENSYAVASFFTLIQQSEQEVEYYEENENVATVRFENLEWEFCSNKQYLIGVYFDAYLFASNQMNATSCLGEMSGISFPYSFNNIDIWYNPILDTQTFALRIDADLAPPSNTPPAPVQVLNIYPTAESITIFWKEPCSSSEILSYHVEIEPHFTDVILDSNHFQYTFKDLSAQGSYRIYISAINAMGESVATTLDVVTLELMYNIQWVAQSGPSSNVGDSVSATAVAIDAQGNSIVVGTFFNRALFGSLPPLLASKFVEDSFIVKYDTEGVPVWAQHLGRSKFGQTEVTDVSVDSRGDIYIVGQFAEVSLLADNATELSAVDNSDNAFVAKYSSLGGFLYVKQIGDNEGLEIFGSSITTDANDRVIAIGTYEAHVPLVFYNDANHHMEPIEDGGFSVFVAVWNEIGVLVSTRSIYCTAEYFSKAISVTTDSLQNIYVLGGYYRNVFIENDYLVSEYDTGFYVAKFSASLDFEWIVGFTGEEVHAYHIACDSTSLVIACSTGSELYRLTASSSSDVFGDLEPLDPFTMVMAISSEQGDVLWQQGLSELEAVSVKGVDIASSGQVIVTGQAVQLDGEVNFTNVFFAGLNVENGSLEWNSFTGSSLADQVASALATHGDTAVSVGRFEFSAVFDCDISTITSAIDSYIAKLVSFENNVPSSPPANRDCGQLLFTNYTGTIQFPLQNNETYPNGIECQWLIQIENVPHITATLVFFDFADRYDSLLFYDGNSTSHRELHYYTGNTAFVIDQFSTTYDNYYDRQQVEIQTSGPSLLIQFRSGECFRGFGFKLEYKSSSVASFCDNDFEQTYTLQSGLISQRQSGGYRDHSDCFFYVNPPSARLVLLEFVKFELAREDFIEVIDESGDEPIVLGRFYGDSATYPIQSIGSSLAVHFVSDQSNRGNGFILKYQGITTPIFCEPSIDLSGSKAIRGNITSQNLAINYSPDALCSWNIAADEAMYNHFYLYFSKFDVSLPGSVHVDLLIPQTTKNERMFSVPVVGENQLFISNGPEISVGFNASGTQGSGFIGHYCAVPINGQCQPKIFTTKTAMFDNHFCGPYYQQESDCEWIFRPQVMPMEVVQYLMITFPLIDFQNVDETNPTDYIDIFAGNQLISRLSQAKGAFLDPPTFVTTSSDIRVHFVSDEIGSAEGFDAVACTSIANSSNSCNGNNFISSSVGQFNNYFCGKVHGANAQCIWKVQEKAQPIIRTMIILNHLQFAAEDWRGTGWGDNVIISEYNEPVRIFNYGGSHQGGTLPSNQQNGESINDPEVFSFIDSEVDVTFVSDNQGFTNGFEVDYCLYESGDSRLCSANRRMFDHRGSFHNHACGLYYQASANCRYIVEPSNSTQQDIILYITSADFFNEAGTVTDFIKIYDGTAVLPQFQIGEFSDREVNYNASTTPGDPYFPKTFIGTRNGLTVAFSSDDKLFGTGFDATYCTIDKPAQTCGGGSNIMDHSGILRDHTCGPTYYAPMECTWNVIPSGNNFTHIVFIFKKLDIASHVVVEVINTSSGEIFSTTGTEVFDYDYYDYYGDNIDDYGNYDYDDYYGDYDDYYEDDEFFENEADSGIIEGTAVFVQGNAASIQFTVAEGAALKTGWEIQYLTVSDTLVCSGESQYTAPQGYIQDHVYGAFYANQQACSFLIQIPTAESIAVRFDYFELEDGFDFLEIYDGDGWNAPLIGFLTGDSLPNPFVSSGNALYLTFRSDSSFVERGFRLFYSDASLTNCPLFCSGKGTCNTTTHVCSCSSDRYGLGCELFPPPRVSTARFSDSLDTIILSFQRDTNRANMFGSQSTNCSVLVKDSTLRLLGFQPFCLWADDATFFIRLGNEATVFPGDSVLIRGGLIQDKNPTVHHPVGTPQEILVEAPRKPYPPQVIIIAPTILNVGLDLTLDASATYLTGGRKPFYYWEVLSVCKVPGDNCTLLQQKLSGYVEQQHDEVLHIANHYFLDYPLPVAVHFSCTAINFLGMASRPGRYLVQVPDVNLPVPIIDGPKDYEIEFVEDLFIRSFVDVTSDEFQEIIDEVRCPDISWSWGLERDVGPGSMGDFITLPSDVALNRSDIFIPGATLDFDSRYVLSLNLTYATDTIERTREALFIKVRPFTLEIIIPGGLQVVSSLSPIRLIAQPIPQQEQLAERIRYRWACRKANGYPCQTISNEFLTLQDNAQIEIAPNTLPANDYTFLVMASFDNGGMLSTARSSISLRVLRRNQVAVKILRRGVGKHDARKPLILTGVTDPPEASLQWQVIAGDLSLNSQTLWSPTATGLELVLAPNILQDGATYRFGLQANATGLSSNLAEIDITVNEAPSAARLVVSPSFGFSRTTKFEFTLKGASDDRTDMPLHFVFGLIATACPKSEVGESCAFVPISNSKDNPRFDALLPEGEYYPAVDVFDRIGSFRRIISPDTITSFEAARYTTEQWVAYITDLAHIAKAYNCLNDFDAVRQIVNIASVSLSEANVDVSAALEIYFTELEGLLETVDSEIPSTEIFVDNRVKSLLLSSFLSLSNRTEAIGKLLSNSKDIATQASVKGFLRTDSAESLLGSLSNLISQGVAPADVASVFATIQGITGGELQSRTCNNIANEVSSTNIKIRNQRQSPESLAGAQLSSEDDSGTSSSFILPSSVDTDLSCINYAVVSYDMKIFDDGMSTSISLPAALTLTDSTNSVIQLPSGIFEIRIPVTEEVPSENELNCSSWNEETEQWEINCEYIGVENGFYVMQSSHLTTFSVLLGANIGNGGGSGGDVSISTFGSFASDFTGATELFGQTNLDNEGNLRSSFTALSEIPTEAFDSSNEVYQLLQYSYESDEVYERTYAYLSVAFISASIVVILIAVVLIEVRYKLKLRRRHRVLNLISNMESPSLSSSSEATL